MISLPRISLAKNHLFDRTSEIPNLFGNRKSNKSDIGNYLRLQKVDRQLTKFYATFASKRKMSRRTMPQPYKAFTIYAREDAQYLEELRGQLRPLEIAGRIKV